MGNAGPDTYRIVFEVTQKSFQWWFPAMGLAGAVVACFLTWLAKHFRRAQWWFGFLLAAFCFYWFFSALASTYPAYQRIQQAYRTGQYLLVAGRVEDFHPMPYEGHQDECFSVQQVRFCYSDYTITPAFNHTSSHGGPIRAGLPVRIAYVGPDILRLEVAENRESPAR